MVGVDAPPTPTHAERPLRIEHEDALPDLGVRLAAALVPALAEGMVLDLRGDLGVGKTALVRAIARALGVPARIPIASPTFTIAATYDLPPGPDGAPRGLAHLDAYRLPDEAALEAAGFADCCGSGWLTCVEWGARVAAGLPRDRIEVHLDMDLAALSNGSEDAPWTPGEVPVCPRTGRLVATGPRAAAVLARLGDVA